MLSVTPWSGTNLPDSPTCSSSSEPSCLEFSAMILFKWSEGYLLSAAIRSKKTRLSWGCTGGRSLSHESLKNSFPNSEYKSNGIRLGTADCGLAITFRMGIPVRIPFQVDCGLGILQIHSFKALLPPTPRDDVAEAFLAGIPTWVSWNMCEKQDEIRKPMRTAFALPFYHENHEPKQITFIWKCIRVCVYIYIHIMAYIFWHSILAFYLAFYLTFYSDILFWHSTMTSYLASFLASSLAFFLIFYLASIYSDILSGIFSGILFGILSDILFWHSIWHPLWHGASATSQWAVQTEIWSSLTWQVGKNPKPKPPKPKPK